jgi:hypothetical protein
MSRQSFRSVLFIAVFFGVHVLSCPANSQSIRNADGDAIATVTATVLNLRSEPSTKAAIVAKVKQGDQFPVLEQNSEWLQVRLQDGKTGWSLKKYFDVTTVRSAAADPPEIPAPQTSRTQPQQQQWDRDELSAENPVVTRTASASLGIIGGYSISRFSGMDAGDSYATRVGYSGGGVMILPFSNVLGLQAELLYVMKGAAKAMDGITSTLQIDYLELPLLLRVSFPVSPSVGVYVTGGGAVSYNLQATLTSDAPGMQKHDVTEIASFDYGASAGGGVQLNVAFLRLLLDARYTIGLAAVHAAASDPLDLKHRCLTVSLGWLF